VVQYKYDWNGARQTRSGVGPFNRIELSSRFKRARHAALIKAREQKSEIVCFVNPDRPSESFLYREFRGWTFAAFIGIALLFSGCGFLVVRQKPNEIGSADD